MQTIRSYCFLGGGNKLVATTDVIRNNPWFAEVLPKIKTVPALTNGQSIQMEALLATRPDAVLMSNPTMQQQVEKAGMKAVLVNFQTLTAEENRPHYRLRHWW